MKISSILLTKLCLGRVFQRPNQASAQLEVELQLSLDKFDQETKLNENDEQIWDDMVQTYQENRSKASLEQFLGEMIEISGDEGLEDVSDDSSWVKLKDELESPKVSESDMNAAVEFTATAKYPPGEMQTEDAYKSIQMANILDLKKILFQIFTEFRASNDESNELKYSSSGCKAIPYFIILFTLTAL